MVIDFSDSGIPEPGDWSELARRYNALSDEALPTNAYVWGAGLFGREIARRLTQSGSRILGIVDRNPAFRANGVDGLPCLSPDELLSREPAVVVLGMHNCAVDYSGLLAQLRLRGFEAWLPQRVWRAAALTGQRWPAAYWLDHPFWGQQDPLEALNEARQAFSLFADDASARVFWGELCARALGDVGLRAVPEPQQYSPASLPAWPQPVRLIDAGAFDGDTLRSFAQSGISISHSLCFEPDHVNFEALQAARPHGGDMMCLPLGLSDRTKSLRFQVDRGGASRLSDEGDTVVQCVSLDEAAPDFPATLLKMDIEGAELDAIRGASRLIGRSRCSMAISAYHTPDHLWKVPLLMHLQAPEHLLFLRAHAFNGFDTVAYALPPDTRAHLTTRPKAPA